MFSFPRLLILALLPVIFLLGTQIGYLRWTSSPQAQTLLSSFLPTPLQEFVLFNRPRIHIRQGTVIGTTAYETLLQPVDVFRGIPYAIPPVGDRRFRRAEPVGESEGLLDASQFGPRCPGKQLLPVNGDSGSNEDCLTVNIFRPSGVKDKLPVAVYVHGGAYNRGTAAMHNTASMVGWSDKPFIGATFNYRIGALGFLPSTTTAEEGVLNLGLHDQILLFKWVQDNIEAFGGDPTRVTLIGLSAGAHSIAHHIMNYDLQHTLFHRAIIESGATTSRAMHPYNGQLHEDQFGAFVEAAGCTNLLSTGVMACLRSQPSEVITNASFAVFDQYNPSVRWAFQPVIDGELIKQRPIDAWKSGKWNQVPILTGFNTNEGTYYVPRSMAKPEEFTSFFHTLLPAYTPEDIKTIDSLYPDPASDPESPYVETRDIAVGPQYKRVEAAYGHYAYACPVRQTVTFASQGQDAPVFLYRWALNKTVLGGANHGDQMAYETQDEVAGTFHAYITSFIASGDPNAVDGRYPGRPEWKGYDATTSEGQNIMLFGDGNDERAGGENLGIPAQLVPDEWSRKECEFWWAKAGVSD